MPGKDHIYGPFDTALENLRNNVLMMASLTERSTFNALRGLLERDSALCNQVIADDQEIDALEVEVDHDGVNILTRFHPVATDMRRVIAAMKLGANLERIADQATNIARKTRKLNEEPALDSVALVHPLFESALRMFRDTLKAHADDDTVTAREIIRRDKALDEQNREIANRLTREITIVPDRARDYIALIFIAGHIERIGDHCKSIAEDTVYSGAGSDIRHKPRK